MSRPVEEPVVTIMTDRGREGMQRVAHPAFAQIVAVQKLGSTGYLYGSDFGHRQTIGIQIRRSETVRGLSKDWHHGREQLIEVELSQAQWATFISTMGNGDGVPCTLLNVTGEVMPELPAPRMRSEQFGGEMDSRLVTAREHIQKARAALAASGLSKGKQNEILSELGMAERDIGSSVEFVAESFDKHMEQTVEKAKIEVHAYTTGVIQRAGLEAIGAKAPVTFLEGPQS